MNGSLYLQSGEKVVCGASRRNTALNKIHTLLAIENYSPIQSLFFLVVFGVWDMPCQISSERRKTLNNIWRFPISLYLC